jgi:transcriptional regulator, ArsR family
MNKITIKTATPDDFFRRGREIARKADAGKTLPREKIISFDDPADLLSLLTTARLDVYRAVQERPESITGVASRLHRDRSAVKRDVDALARAGLLAVEDKVLPGHGRMKEVRSVAARLQLVAVVG